MPLGSGLATLVGGTVAVADAKITATSRIRLTTLTPGGTVGTPYVASRTAGTGFTITSTSGTDTSTVFYEVVTYAVTTFDAVASPILDLGPGLWLKPEALSALSGGAAVATWPDSSGDGVDVTQATGAQQPLYQTAQQNGLPAVVFDGVNDWLTRAAFKLPTKAASVFVVSRLDAAGSYPDMMSYGLTGTEIEFRYSAATGQPEWVTNLGNTVAPTAVTLGAWHQFTGMADGASRSFWVDAALISSVADAFTPTASNILGIGSRSSGVSMFGGAIAEMLIFPYALTTAQRQTVEAYLKAKWATP